mmetsp:Transcript_18423/g.42006  ORF Transcript_18423/g.42006 Transcript_18423/m.42006 type:complete len:267 (+) Transcript_18423:138-938(+)
MRGVRARKPFTSKALKRHAGHVVFDGCLPQILLDVRRRYPRRHVVQYAVNVIAPQLLAVRCRGAPHRVRLTERALSTFGLLLVLGRALAAAAVSIQLLGPQDAQLQVVLVQLRRAVAEGFPPTMRLLAEVQEAIQGALHREEGAGVAHELLPALDQPRAVLREGGVPPPPSSVHVADHGGPLVVSVEHGLPGSCLPEAVLLEQLVELDLRHAAPPAQRILVSDGRGAAQAEDRVHGAVAAAADNGGGACVGEYRVGEGESDAFIVV